MYNFFFLLLISFELSAQLAAPSLHVTTKELTVTLEWSADKEAMGYNLLYAPYPYQGEETIVTIDMKDQTSLTVDLPEGSVFYIAIQAYDKDKQASGFSNIGFLQIQDRGNNYHSFWKTVIGDINAGKFATNDFLYSEIPNVQSCFAGVLTQEARLRELTVLNKIRQLHQLSILSYDDADGEAQAASLIQRANDFLSHTPPTSALCYTQKGFDGSKSSNLHIANETGDPAQDLISLMDDATNISLVSGVGHRRAMLNPFMRFTSYGQVFGGSVVKIFDFSDKSITDANDIPDFIAFPYMRYPYVFFSDKTMNKKTPWSLSIVEDKLLKRENRHEYFSKAKITVIQKDTGKVLDVADIFTDTDGFGVPNLLSWTVGEWQYDTWYSVVISELDYQSSSASSISYDVFIDYKNFVNIVFPLENEDLEKAQSKDDENLRQVGQSIVGSLFDEDDKDSFEVDLVGEVNFVGKSKEFANMAYFINLYDRDKKLLMSKDESFTINLASDRYTVVISNCDENLTCYSQSKNYTVDIN